MDSLKVLDPEGPIREADIVGHRGHVRKVPGTDITGEASMQGEPKRVGRRSNWNRIGKHGHAFETTPEPSTCVFVDIT
jgi:hypothetical protein